MWDPWSSVCALWQGLDLVSPVSTRECKIGLNVPGQWWAGGFICSDRPGPWLCVTVTVWWHSYGLALGSADNVNYGDMKEPRAASADPIPLPLVYPRGRLDQRVVMQYVGYVGVVSWLTRPCEKKPTGDMMGVMNPSSVLCVVSCICMFYIPVIFLYVQIHFRDVSSRS